MSDDPDPVDCLAEEFLDRLRSGERISVEEFARTHPDHEALIREIFPALIAMEKLASDRQDTDLPPPRHGERRE